MDYTPWLFLFGALALFALRGWQGRAKVRRVQALFQEGVAALREERPADAEIAFRQCIKRSPATAALHRMLGRALATQSRFEEAADAMGTAAALEPKNAEARLEHGLMLAHCGLDKADATRDVIRKALDLKPALREVLQQATELGPIRAHPAVAELLADAHGNAQPR